MIHNAGDGRWSADAKKMCGYGGQGTRTGVCRHIGFCERYAFSRSPPPRLLYPSSLNHQHHLCLLQPICVCCRWGRDGLVGCWRGRVCRVDKTIPFCYRWKKGQWRLFPHFHSRCPHHSRPRPYALHCRQHQHQRHLQQRVRQGSGCKWAWERCNFQINNFATGKTMDNNREEATHRSSRWHDE
jgi:hypothetical protein